MLDSSRITYDGFAAVSGKRCLQHDQAHFELRLHAMRLHWCVTSLASHSRSCCSALTP